MSDKTAKSKRRGNEEIRKDIIRFLERADFPCTTGEIAKEVRLNWYSANFHLAHLKADGKVFHKKVGRQNQWCLMEKYRHGFVGHKK